MRRIEKPRQEAGACTSISLAAQSGLNRAEITPAVVSQSFGGFGGLAVLGALMPTKLPAGINVAGMKSLPPLLDH